MRCDAMRCDAMLCYTVQYNTMNSMQLLLDACHAVECNTKRNNAMQLNSFRCLT
jgi:hypothetical protein